MWLYLTLHEGLFESQVIPSIDEKLVFEMLRRMEVFARRFLTAAATLFSRRGVTRSDRRYYLILIYIYICMATYFDGVITCNYPSILYFDSRRRMSKLALRVWSCTLVSLELSADFELQPP